MSTHLMSSARGRVAFVAGGLAVVLSLTGCDSGSGDDIAAAGPTALVDETSAGPSNSYVVDSGDTLSGIAAGYGVSLDELVGVNEWSDGSDHAIFPGDVIALPDDAVAVSTTARAPSNGDDNDDEPRASGTSSTAATSGGYAATGEVYVGPTLDGSTDPIIVPLPDGVYWSFEPSVSDDRSTITFEVVQQFSGDTCREHFGTSNSCLSDIDFETATATASMRVDAGTASVLYLHGGIDVEAYRTSAEELARLLAGTPPADDAPDDFQFGPHPFVLTVQNGAVTAADQIWIS